MFLDRFILLIRANAAVAISAQRPPAGLTVLIALAFVPIAIAGHDVLETFDEGMIQSLDTEGVEWRDSGDVPWDGSDTHGLFESAYYESGVIGDLQRSELVLIVQIAEGGGTIQFDWAIDCQYRSDYLRIWVGGDSSLEITGRHAFGETYPIALDPGETAIVFSYQKDVLGSDGADAAGIDNVLISNVIPEPGVALWLVPLMLAGALRRRT